MFEKVWLIGDFLHWKRRVRYPSYEERTELLATIPTEELRELLAHPPEPPYVPGRYRPLGWLELAQELDRRTAIPCPTCHGRGIISSEPDGSTD